MGSTPKPLTILVTDPEMMEWQGVVALREQGHTIFTVPPQPVGEHWNDEDAWRFVTLMSQVDGVLGPSAWYMDKQHAPYFDLAIKAFRRKRYPVAPRKKKETK